MGIDETGSSNIGAIWAVRQGQQNRRGRGRNNNNRKSHNPLARSFESNGPDVKIRGTPAHIAEKYLTLSRDAQSSGDPVLAENYLQHAEHYTRIIEETEGIDPVTQDMVIDILHDEQGHRRLFEGFLREYEAEGLA